MPKNVKVIFYDNRFFSIIKLFRSIYACIPFQNKAMIREIIENKAQIGENLKETIDKNNRPIIFIVKIADFAFFRRSSDVG